MRRLFSDHPASIGESYGEHMGHALSLARHMLIGGLACVAHALLPCLFVSSGSRRITLINDQMAMRRRPTDVDVR